MAAGPPMPNRPDGVIDPRFGPGTQLGKYELIAPIGAGGMASVILARQRGPGGFEKVVVIKVVHPHLAQDEVAVNMLLDEGRLAALIEHPNVVHTYEIGEAHGTFYIVMEYLAGESLHSVIRHAIAPSAMPFDPYVAARIVADAAEGLHTAHELVDFQGHNRGIVHRDVSPGNVVVLYSGQVKVVDFGIAKAHGRVTSTQDGELKGKYGYMAPEQINNEPMDRRSDVFSLGVTLWEALAKRRLFQTDSVGATLMSVLQGPRLAPSTYDRTVPPELDRIALMALQPDPRNRYQSAGEMKRAIDDAIWQTRVGSAEISAYMTALFADRIEQRRRLLAAAGQSSVDEVVQLLTRERRGVRPANHGFAEAPATPKSIRRKPSGPLPFGTAPEALVPALLPARARPPSHPHLAAPPPSTGLRLGAPGAARPHEARAGASEDEARWGRYLVRFCAIAIAVVGAIVIAARVGHRAAVVPRPHPAHSQILDPAQLAPTPTAGPSVPPPSTLEPAAGVTGLGPGNPPAPTAIDAGDVGTAATVATVPDAAALAPVPVLVPTPTPTPTPPPGGIRVRPRPPTPPRPPGPVAKRGSAADATKAATSRYLAGDLDGAKAGYKQAIAIDRNYAAAHRGLGIIYQRTGESVKAIASLERYLQLSPHAPDADSIQKRIDQLSK